VRPGDKLRVRLTVKEARPLKTKPNVGLVLNHWQVLNQDGDEVMQMDGYGMFLRRDV
jgi:acyl dehydratase